jgi:8-oxo-dGTP diphosphatase
MVDVLLTGFDPFGSNSTNISRQVCDYLSEKGISKISPLHSPKCSEKGAATPPRGDAVEIEWHIEDLSVDEAGSSLVANNILSSRIIHSGDKIFTPHPQAILHLGLCSECEVPRIELVATNSMDFKIADNSGRQISSASSAKNNPIPVIQDGPSKWASTVAAKYFPRHLLSIPVDISTDAGNFVCNETYARTLDAVTSHSIKDRMNRQLPTLFLHLPPVEKISLLKQVKLVEELAAWMITPHTLTVAGAVLIGDDGRIFSCRRSKNESFAGGWEFPGGKVESGESIKECLVREMDEELAIEIEVGKPLGIIRKSTGPFVLEIHTWSCMQKSGEIQLSVHDASRWLELSELQDAEWMDTDAELIPQIVNSLSN